MGHEANIRPAKSQIYENGYKAGISLFSINALFSAGLFFRMQF